MSNIPDDIFTEPEDVDPDTLADHRDAVLALWRTVFG